MPTSDRRFIGDPLDILLAHDHGATRKVLELCRGLTFEQFHRPFPIGPADRGGLHATLLHMLGAGRRWADRIAGRPLRPMLRTAADADGFNDADARNHSADDLLALNDQTRDDLAAAIAEARRIGLDSAFEMTFGEKTYTFTRGAALVHVLTHGHYHRAQCMNMLRHLSLPGVSDRLPELDTVDWQAEVTGQG